MHKTPGKSHGEDKHGPAQRWWLLIWALNVGSCRSAALPNGQAGIALHMHFNWAYTWMNVFWFLDETPLCKPTNFVACLFVSDWLSDAEAAVEFFEHQDPDSMMSRHGTPVYFRHCNANRQGPFHGWYMYACFAESLQFLLTVPGTHGVLFLADDAVLIRPWHAVRDELAQRTTMLLPSFTHKENMCDLRTLIGQACNTAGLKEAEEKDSLIQAMQILADFCDSRSCSVAYPALAHKAMGDVAYVPMDQARQFVQLAALFYQRRVFVEFALPAIAFALGGNFSKLGTDEPLHLHDLWEDRAHALQIIHANNSVPTGYLVETPFWTGPSNLVAFVHPIKIGVDDMHREAVNMLYTDVFG